MESNATDAELLLRSVLEPAVFGELYERHGVAVRRYVVSRIGSTGGEDLAAEVFIRAFRGRETCRAESSALPWLLGVANHVISDHRRSRSAGSRRLSGSSLIAVSPRQRQGTASRRR